MKYRSIFFILLMVVSVFASSNVLLTNANTDPDLLVIRNVVWSPSEPYDDESLYVQCFVNGFWFKRGVRLGFSVNGIGGAYIFMNFHEGFGDDDRGTFSETINNNFYSAGDTLKFWILVRFPYSDEMSNIFTLTILGDNQVTDPDGYWEPDPDNLGQTDEWYGFIPGNDGGVNVTIDAGKYIIIFLLGTIVFVLWFRIRRRKK